MKLQKLLSRRGFSLAELIVVLGLLGLLSLIVIPRITIYNDKAMGNTALTDCKTVMAAALTHNMNNAKKFDDADLRTRMGLNANNQDSSGMKTIKRKNQTDINLFTYTYTRGSVKITAEMDIMTQNITWTLSGLTRQDDQDRIEAIEDGLKVTRGTLTIK